MSLQDNLFTENAEEDLRNFLKNKKHKRVLIFPPVNSYRRLLIHQLVQDHFGDLLQTFSIGQGIERRNVICYKSDYIKLPKINGDFSKQSVSYNKNSIYMMGIESKHTATMVPVHSAHKIKNVELYRPPAARCAKLEDSLTKTLPVKQTNTDVFVRKNRQKRPDRAVYVPKHRRSFSKIETNNVSLQENQLKMLKERFSPNLKSFSEKNINKQTTFMESRKSPTIFIDPKFKEVFDQAFVEQPFVTNKLGVTNNIKESKLIVDNVFSPINKFPKNKKMVDTVDKSFIYQRNPSVSKDNISVFHSEQSDTLIKSDIFCNSENLILQVSGSCKPLKHCKKPYSDNKVVEEKLVSEVLIISSYDDKSEMKDAKPFVPIASLTLPEKKVKKIERTKSKPASPPLLPSKINRDECDWDSLFDDNGDCLDPTLIEELTSSVGEVIIEKPKCSYKTYGRSVEISSGEFAHVLEIYNFPSEFKSSDLAAIFSSYKNGGFELKWVDDTHCLGVFSSPVVAAEVLATNHPFVKTRPLSEATILSKTKARRSSEFLQPYKSRPETCAALARRLVTKSLGVTLATARQEREQEKIVLREAKEKKRLANKQREDVWEGIITEKTS